jgi:hypothetical protein
VKIMLRAAIMVVSIGTSSAHADDSDACPVITLFISSLGEQPSLCGDVCEGTDSRAAKALCGDRR